MFTNTTNNPPTTIDPTLGGGPTLPPNYPCPPTDLNSQWYTYQPVPWPYPEPFNVQEFCDSDWCVDQQGNPILSGPTASGAHPDCACCPTFDCISGQCVENATGTGFYDSKLLCLESNCGKDVVTPPSY